jgi:hypothetical protein
LALAGNIFACAVAFSFAPCLGSCAQSDVGRPVASVATTTEAAAAFAPIATAWSSDAKERAALRDLLATFLVRFSGDGLAPLARTYFALSLVDGGDLTGGERELAVLGAVPPGATADLAQVVRAKDLRLRGQPAAAFELLRGLVGKAVDSTTRAILQEEISLAAIEGRRDYEAIAYFDTWLRNAAEEDHVQVRAKVAAALAKEPEPVLMDALRAMRSGGPASGYGREIERLVTERLAAIAIERKDTDLARWLVAADTGTSLLGETEGALGELATTKRGLASVDGRTIGLVLPTGSSDLRDEAAAILRGAATALDLPRADASKGDRTKLVTRDDGGDVDRVEPTLSELAGEGAVVLLAALEPESAARAVKWGELHGVVVITFAVPGAGVAPTDWAFTVGVARDAEIATLAEELVSRAFVKIVPVVPPGGSPAVDALAKGSVQLEKPVACDTAAAQSGEARFPVEEWKRAKAHAWLVDAPSECARDLVRGLDVAGVTGTVALTLDAAGATARAPSLKLTAVHVGEIPLVGDAIDPDLRAWTKAAAAPPNYWTALGRDAALLARRAVAALPLDATSDAAEVGRRRVAAKDALLAATAHLWTTESPGFGGARTLPRIVGVVDLSGDAKAGPKRPR